MLISLALSVSIFFFNSCPLLGVLDPIFKEAAGIAHTTCYSDRRTKEADMNVVARVGTANAAWNSDDIV
jgi:hypothetical protein